VEAKKTFSLHKGEVRLEPSIGFYLPAYPPKLKAIIHAITEYIEKSRIVSYGAFEIVSCNIPRYIQRQELSE
jgi:hypothetical protein